MTTVPDEDARIGAELRAFAAAPPPPYPAERFEGRGIVMCAGGTRLLTCAWVSLAFLRRDLGCTLPVELWHLGPEELGPTEAAMFDELGVTCVDAFSVRREHPARVLGGWELKPYAVVHSRFAEVVLLDADCLPLVDPAALFESAGYRDAGALFWPDLVRLEPDNGMWELCGVSYRNEPAWEAGQAVVDKRRHWHALQVTLWMNMHSDVFYRHSHGDKDTFHLAWRMLGRPVSITRYPPKPTASGITQRGPDGAPLFQHRSTAKWLLHGDNLQDPGFLYEDRCRSLLAELSSRWTGRIEPAPPGTEEDRRREEELVIQQWFTVERRGWDRRTVQLLRGHRVGVGASGEDRRWWVEDGQLVLAGMEGPTCRLAPDGAGWSGRWEQPPHHVVVVRPASSSEVDPVVVVVDQVLDGLAAGTVDSTDAATAIGVLATVFDLGEVFARQRSQRPGDDVALDVLRAAEARAGSRDPSLRPHGAAAGHRYAPR